MKNGIKQKLWIGAFFFMICCAQPFWLIAGKQIHSENYENRTLADKPVFSIDTIEEYPAAWEAYYNDRLPFRNQLIRLNSRVEYYVFQNSSNRNVIKGGDGWLYYNNVKDGDPIECYKGIQLFTEEELACIADNIEYTENMLEEKGIEFVLFIAPNKERVYPEYMPEYYGKPAQDYRVKQVVDYLQNYTDIRVVYPYEELMEAKEKYPQRLYYRLDTHWNYIGGYIGTSALLKELGIQMPPLETLTITETEPTICDLADMINMRTDLNTDADYILSGYDEYHLVTEKHDMRGEYIYHCTGADQRKLFMVRDSFADAMSEFLASRFNASYMVHRNSYSRELVDEKGADIFVYEVAERYIYYLEDFPLKLK